MSNLAKVHKAINLGQGFPNFDTSDELKNLVASYIHEGYNQYAPMPGQLKLRETISQKIHSLYSQNIDPQFEITITAGATQALYTSITALVNHRDEVIIFEPAYDSYKPTVEINGGKVVPIQLQAPYFNIPWEELKSNINPKTKLIIINSPHNPTGQTLSKDDLEELQKIVLEHNLYLLSDEVYEHLIYDGHIHESVLKYPELYKRSIITYSFGKTFHNTGWKLGYAVAPKYLTEQLRNIHQWNVFSVNSFAQMGVADYLANPESYDQLNEFYQQKRDVFNEHMTGSSLKALPSKGTYFQLYDYSSMSDMDDITFAEWLTKEHKIATIPISPFYSIKPDFKIVRVCFAKTEDVLIKAASVLSAI